MKDKFPWLPLQITAGALTGLGLIATIWQFRKARAKRTLTADQNQEK